jgi:F-type H+-transporting ATPase subunit epsilon
MLAESENIDPNNCLKLDIVTPETSIFSDFVNSVTVLGVDGELGILPHHCSLITLLQPGELKIIKGHTEIKIPVGGGFLEVNQNRIIVLADTKRDESVEAQKIAEAKSQARQISSHPQPSLIDEEKVLSSLRLEAAREKMAEKRRKRNKPII